MVAALGLSGQVHSWHFIGAEKRLNPQPNQKEPRSTTVFLKHTGAQIRQVDLPRLTQGVLHTKFWIVDQLHIYLGSANMDWRALTQVIPLSHAQILGLPMGDLMEQLMVFCRVALQAFFIPLQRLSKGCRREAAWHHQAKLICPGSLTKLFLCGLVFCKSKGPLGVLSHLEAPPPFFQEHY